MTTLWAAAFGRGTKVVVHALAIGYFFVVAALAGFAVRMAYQLAVQFRQAWLLSYTFYLASWGAFVLLSVVQYLLIGGFLSGTEWDRVAAATRPLFTVSLSVCLYFFSSFMARLTGGRLSRTYTVAYIAVWTATTVAISVGGALLREPSAGLAAMASFSVFVLKTATLYGWMAHGLLATRHIRDPLERSGVGVFVLLLIAGFLAFDLVMRDATAVIGLHTGDVTISFVQVGLNYPPLLWATRFLRRRAVERPPEAPPSLKSDLAALGLSAREAEVVELLITGLSHKEIAERLSISPETVKKHIYNAYRKLGVQNRVQLLYFVQNRTTAGALER